MTIREALGIGDDLLALLRARAGLLYSTKQWERCARVLMGLAELDDVRIEDPMMLARCFEELGRHDVAAACRNAHENLLSQVEAVLRERERRP